MKHKFSLAVMSMTSDKHSVVYSKFKSSVLIICLACEFLLLKLLRYSPVYIESVKIKIL